MKRIRALMVEDRQDDTDLLLLQLRKCGYDVEWVRVMTAADMAAQLKTGRFDIIFSDYSMPDFSALGALELHRESGLDLPFIIISGTIGEETAVGALKAGAHDFLVKGQLARLGPAVERELREYQTRSARRRAEEAVRQSEATLRALMEGLEEVVFVQRDLRITYANPAAAKLLGYGSTSELLGKHVVDDIVHPEERETTLERTRRARSETVRAPGDVRWVKRDGGQVTVQVHAQPLTIDGQPSVMVVARDVTEQRKMEAQLLISDRMASIGTLAAGVAHEINNPLAVVVANLPFVEDELRRQSVTDPEVHSALAEAREAAERVRHIVRDLKVFSRSSDAELREPVDLVAVLESSARMAHNEVRHRAQIVKQFDEVPPVIGNEPRLGQVFVNLIVNAAQAISEGRSESNEIRLATYVRADGRVVAEVRDTGAGMPPEVVRKLFTPFFTTKPVGVGTGLGLSICHRIITSMAGEIEVESAPGKGTTFRVILPQAKQGGAAAPAAIPTAPVLPSRKGRVLVVDDEVLIGRTVQRALRPHHDVTAVTSGADALALIARGEQFDLILCDLTMPHMTGMEFHEHIEREHRGLSDRIVFLSGGAFTPTLMKFMERLKNERIEKPFDVGHLLEFVRRRVDGS